MARLTIVGINYAPEPTAVGPYTARLAEHAAELGHDVTVVAGLPSYPEWRVRRGYRRLFADEQINGVRVLRGAHYVPQRQSALRRAVYEGTFALTGAIAAGCLRGDLLLCGGGESCD